MRAIAVIGLGYVGLGLAVALSRHYKVYGYDISETRVNALKDNFDRNKLSSSAELIESSIEYVTDINLIKNADFFIVAVSTPAYYYQLPDLDELVNATKDLGRILKRGDVVVYESTVYPGTTEEICLQVLEEESHLRAGIDFNIGYSPERINPGDTEHTLENTPKVIAAQNEQTLKLMEQVYGCCCQSTYRVSTIKTAEAVKILENTQRDICIAMMNEFSQIMHALELNTHEIIEAAKTKWSFFPIKPGFVSGHCIPVDPLYLAFKAKQVGVEHDLILTARKVNDGMTHFIINELNKLFIKYNIPIDNSPIGIFGITYKENTPDIRNNIALKFIKELKASGFTCQIHDPFADKQQVLNKYKIELLDFEQIDNISAAIIIIGHDYYSKQGVKQILAKITPSANSPKIIMDIPNLFIGTVMENTHYWSL